MKSMKPRNITRRQITEYRRGMEELTKRFEGDREAAEELMDLLPYSTIPGPDDAIRVLDFVAGNAPDSLFTKSGNDHETPRAPDSELIIAGDDRCYSRFESDGEVVWYRVGGAPFARSTAEILALGEVRRAVWIEIPDSLPHDVIVERSDDLWDYTVTMKFRRVGESFTAADLAGWLILNEGIGGE